MELTKTPDLDGTRAILNLLKDHTDHVLVLWLPRYSLELNLIKGLWGYLKRSALNNHFVGTVESPEKALRETFEDPRQYPATTPALAYKCDTKLLKTA